MITEKQIQALTAILVAETNPEKIYLFGSYATGKAAMDSDLDVLIVVRNELSKEERRKTVAHLGLKTASSDLFFPKDFKIYSLKEFDALKGKKQSFLNRILKSATPLYAA